MVPLTCRGIQSNLDVQPTAVPALDTRVGEPNTGTVSLNNVGTASGTIQAIVLDTQDPALTIIDKPADGTVLAPGGSRSVTVQYLPSGTQSAKTQATLNVLFDNVVRPMSVIAASRP